MERVVIWNWQHCVEALEQAFDTCGAHWLTHQKYPMIHPTQRYWGGNFWWARSDYLRTLPRIAEDSDAARYEAEVWIGKSPWLPHIVDFAAHWPMTGCKP